jgi:ParB/RepB/Spo0J family partition protein
MHGEIEKLKKVPMEAIDLQDRTFSMSFGREKEALISAISRRGLIHPCLLRQTETSPLYQIVMGFRRIEACRDLGFPSIKAFIADSKQMDDEEALLIALDENISTRGLNIIERSLVMGRLDAHLGWKRERIVEEMLPIMGLQPSMALVEAHLALLGLIDHLKLYILAEDCSLTNAVKLSSFSQEDQDHLSVVIPMLKLNENTLKEVLAFLEEVMRRDRISLLSLLDRTNVLAIVRNDGLSRPQRTQRVRKALWAERYPMLSRMEEEFERLKRELHLSPGISFHHAPYFEEEGIRVSFRFVDSKKLREIVEKLHSISERDEIARLLEIGTEIPK